MNKGAAAAYEQIDTTVTANLVAAREVLQNLKLDGDLFQQTRTTCTESRSVNITDYSIAPQPQSVCMKQKERIPPVLVRCPENAKNGAARGRKSRQTQLFPDAQILSRNKCVNGSLEPLENVDELRQTEPRSASPDSLFPKAHYKPRCFKKKELSNKQVCARSPLSPGINYSSRMNTTKDGSDAWDSGKESRSRKSRSSRTTKKSVSNSSCSSTKTDDSISMSQLPMTFYSKDGKMKMLLTNSNDGNGDATGMLMARKPTKDKPVKNEVSSTASPDQELFPPIPKQLISSHQLRVIRNKFSATFNIEQHPVEISGLFSNYDLKKKNIDKLYINGKSYMVN